MKKTVLFLALAFLGLNTLKAQELSQGDKNWGLVFNMGASVDIESSSPGFSIGAAIGPYFKYAFTDVVIAEAEAKYSVRSNYGFENGVLQYLEVPALVCFQIGRGYIGFGGQYNYSLIKPSVISTKNSDLNYFSGVIEFAYIMHWIGRTFMYYSEEGVLACFRIGYGINKIKYTAKDVDFGVGGTRSFHPVFLESSVRWNIGQYFEGRRTRYSHRRR